MEQYKIKEKYRSVCSHCNMPLNELACEAVAEAKAVLDTSSALSGEDRAAIDNYAALFGDV